MTLASARCLFFVILFLNLAESASLALQQRQATSQQFIQVVAASPIEVRPITLVFQRRLDLDGNEHSMFIATSRVKNITDRSICQFSGRALVQTKSEQRETNGSFFIKLRPNEEKDVDVNVVLSQNNKTDAALSAQPLKEITMQWVNEKVAVCEGQSDS